MESSTLDEFFGTGRSDQPLGFVLSGSLSDGLGVKLDPRFTIEHLAVGRYVVIHGHQSGRTFFGIITDIALGASNPDLAHRPPNMEQPFTLEVYVITVWLQV